MFQASQLVVINLHLKEIIKKGKKTSLHKDRIRITATWKWPNIWRLQNNTYLPKMVWRPDSSKENYAISGKSKTKKNGILIAVYQDVKNLEL